MQFYSQDGQDEFIVRLFKNKKEGVFLDIGAYDGLNYSNSLYMEKELSWKGICIEPNPIVFKQLEVNRNCICLNCGVGETKGSFQFLSVSGYGSMLSGFIDMFDEKHLARIDQGINEYGGTKEIINLYVLPLSNIFEEHGIVSIDYCNIDVEGGEMGVLKSIDFSKVKIKVFTIENNYGTKQIGKYLKKYGYRLIAKLGADEVFEQNSKRYLLMTKWRIKKVKNFVYSMWQNIKKK
jgi:FkbM family methyltransferase